MNNKKFLAVMAAMGLVFFAVALGGCGSSSSSSGISADNEAQFIDAVGDVVDDLQSIASSAVSNRRVINAIQDITSQYIITSTTDASLANRAIGKTFMADDVQVEEYTNSSAPSFDRAVYVQLWSGKHITVANNVVTSFETGQSDFQLTITSGDHVTKLTVTPTSTSGYWKAYSGVSTIISSLFNEQLQAVDGGNHTYLLFFYVFSSARVEVTYDNVKLLDGTLSLNYPSKTPDSKTNPIYENTPHTSLFNFTFYPQDNKDYSVGMDFTRNVASSGANSLSNTSNTKMYRKGSTTKTLLDANAGLDITIPSGSVRASTTRLTAFDLNVADRIRIAESSPLDLLSLIGLYVTGTRASEAAVNNNVARINTLLSNAGLSLYLNKNTTKAADIRALAGKIGEYNHVRLGLQFVGANEPELVKDIVNPDDLQDLKTLVGRVSNQAQVLAGLMTSIQGTGVLGDVNVTGNAIITLIFNDLFGTR